MCAAENSKSTFVSRARVYKLTAEHASMTLRNELAKDESDTLAGCTRILQVDAATID